MQKGLIGEEWVDVCMSLQSTDWVHWSNQALKQHEIPPQPSEKSLLLAITLQQDSTKGSDSSSQYIGMPFM